MFISWDKSKPNSRTEPIRSWFIPDLIIPKPLTLRFCSGSLKIQVFPYSYFSIYLFILFFLNHRNGLLARGSWILLRQIECGTCYFVGRIWRSCPSPSWRLFCSHFRLNWFHYLIFQRWLILSKYLQFDISLRKKCAKSLSLNYSS